MCQTSRNRQKPINLEFFGKLQIATVNSANNASIGIIPCPGRNHVDKLGNVWRRNLIKDLDTIEAWGAAAILSLIESQEFGWMGVPNFSQFVSKRTFNWYHLPIPDMSPPKEAFFKAWNVNGVEILKYLEQGQRIIIHCAGGLGRSGMLAAKLLVSLDTSPSKAITQVRSSRPGAIETADQESYIHYGRSLNSSENRN